MDAVDLQLEQRRRFAMNVRALKVRDFCNQTLLATERDGALYDTIRWLDEYGAAHAIVVDASSGASRIVGLVNREILAATILSRPDYDDLVLEDVMDAAPVVVDADDDVYAAAGNIAGCGREVALVVDALGDMVGLLMLADVAHLECGGGERFASAA